MDHLKPTIIEVIIISHGAHGKIAMVTTSVNTLAAVVEEQTKQFEVSNTNYPIDDKLLREFDKLVIESINASVANYLPYRGQESKEGWYEPRIIGKPLLTFRKILHRVRSKPVIQCRYKWKLKKQKKHR